MAGKRDVAKWLNAFREANEFNIRMIRKNPHGTKTALDTKSVLSRGSILARFDKKTEDGISYVWANEGPPQRNIYGRPCDDRFVLLDLDTMESRAVEAALALQPRILLQSSANSSQLWYFVPWIQDEAQQVACAKYLCDQVGIGYEAAHRHQIGRLPHFFNKKSDRPGDFRARLLECNRDAIADVRIGDVGSAKRKRLEDVALVQVPRSSRGGGRVEIHDVWRELQRR